MSRPNENDGTLLRATLDSLLDPHMVFGAVRDDSGTIVDLTVDNANDAACVYLQLSLQEILGSSLKTRFPRTATSSLLVRVSEVIDTGSVLVVDDAPFVSEITDENCYYDIRGVGLGQDQLVLTIRDVTERHQISARLSESEERYRLLAENAWDVIWTMGIDGSITYVSPSVERVRGITPEEAVAQTLDEIHTRDSAAEVRQYYADLYAAIEVGEVPPIYRGELEYYRKDGSIMLGELQVIPQLDATGQVVKILGVTRDISERRYFEQELERLAVTDPLTGVLNRRESERVFTAEMVEAQRYDTPMSLLMLDLDYFKSVNDTYGHQVGDVVLVEWARRITENLRASDTLSRWGGEEFVVLMRHCSIDDATALADRLRTLVAATPFDTVGTITVTIGVTELRPDDEFTNWIDRADRALYAAKSAGRNTVRVE